MTECSKEPSAKELFERIVQLESETLQAGKLRVEVEALKAVVDDLRGALYAEADSVTGALKQVYQLIADERKQVYKYIAEIHDQLWPLVRKVFPEKATPKKTVTMIMKDGGSA